MTEDEPKAWDQLPGESDAAYARFLTYRNLGPSRSLESAYQVASKSVKSRRASGQWFKDSRLFDWSRRAEAWDIEMLSQHGREVVLNFVEGLQIIARKALEALKQDGNKPLDWSAALAAITAIGAFIPGEAVQAVQSGARNGEPVRG